MKDTTKAMICGLALILGMATIAVALVVTGHWIAGLVLAFLLSCMQVDGKDDGEDTVTTTIVTSNSKTLASRRWN